MEYKINDKELKANIFISFVNKVWKGQYDIEKTEAALSKTFNITKASSTKRTAPSTRIFIITDASTVP